MTLTTCRPEPQSMITRWCIRARGAWQEIPAAVLPRFSPCPPPNPPPQGGRARLAPSPLVGGARGAFDDTSARGRAFLPPSPLVGGAGGAFDDTSARGRAFLP